MISCQKKQKKQAPLIWTELELAVSLLLQSEWVDPEAHLSCSHTDTKQGNADTDIQSAIISLILTEKRENIIIPNVCLSSTNILVSFC